MNKDLQCVQISAALMRLSKLLEIPNRERERIVSQKELEEMIDDCKNLLGSLDFPKIKL